MGVLERAHVARAVRPAGARELRLLLESVALVKEHSGGLREDIAVNVVRDMKDVGPDVARLVEDVVVAGLRHAGEVEPPGLVARRGVGGAAVPGDRSRLEELLAAVRVDDSELGAGCERRGGVDAGLRVADDGDLLVGGPVAELIDHDEGAGRSGNGDRRGIGPDGGVDARARIGRGRAAVAALAGAAGRGEDDQAEPSR